MEMSRPGRQFQEFNSRHRLATDILQLEPPIDHQTDVRPRKDMCPAETPHNRCPQAQWPLTPHLLASRHLNR